MAHTPEKLLRNIDFLERVVNRDQRAYLPEALGGRVKGRPVLDARFLAVGFRITSTGLLGLGYFTAEQLTGKNEGWFIFHRDFLGED